MRKPLAQVTCADLATGVVLEDGQTYHTVVAITVLSTADKVGVRIVRGDIRKAEDLTMPLTQMVLVTGGIVS